MSEALATLEQVFQTVDHLNLNDLNLLRERIEQSRQQKTRIDTRPVPTQATELFNLHFDYYLSLSENERDALVFQAYKTLEPWIEQELKSHHAQWMLVCGGEILEFSSKLLEYPSPEKLANLGKGHNRIPFVFIRTPIIEEATWSSLLDDDYYPSLPLRIGKFGITLSEFKSEAVEIEADFDTGASHLLLEFPMRVELDGKARSTRILGEKGLSRKKLQQK